MEPAALLMALVVPVAAFSVSTIAAGETPGHWVAIASVLITAVIGAGFIVLALQTDYPPMREGGLFAGALFGQFAAGLAVGLLLRHVWNRNAFGAWGMPVRLTLVLAGGALAVALGAAWHLPALLQS